MTIHKTARGREFNMQAFSQAKEKTIAVGNSNRNARGDLLGPGGVIIASDKEINQRLEKQQSKQKNQKSKNINLNAKDEIVSKKEVIGVDGIARWEITYLDGSIEVQEKFDSEKVSSKKSNSKKTEPSILESSNVDLDNLTNIDTEYSPKQGDL